MFQNNIKLLIATHKHCGIPKGDVFVPIHVGREIATEISKDGKINKTELNWLLNNTIGDDSGENISCKNRYYSELSAIYWAWKNYDKLGNPDYIGLMHYRRHFIFNNKYYLNKMKFESDYAKGLVYINEEYINENYLSKIALDDNTIQLVVAQSDIIVSYLADLELAYGRKESIKSDYVNNIPGMKVEDFDLMMEVLYRRYPQYKDLFRDYINGKNKNLFQMFIMKKDLFFEYCEFLFGVLFEIEQSRNYEEGYTINGKRTLGYLGEIMLTMFLYMKKNENIRISHFGIAHINYPVTKESYRKILIKNFIKNIFSITNDNNHKIIRLLGLKIKIKRKK